MKVSIKIMMLLAVFATIGTTASAQTADELLARGREAYLDYRFSEASRDYAAAKKKAKRGDTSFEDLYTTYERQLNQARDFMQRVENIVIIDSISVPRDRFFKSYLLPASAGSLGDGKSLPKGMEGDVEYVYTNEGGDYKLWSEPDTTGYSRLVESTLLTDGKWSTPTPLSEDLSEECDAIFPFMMADGVTLYYADNGENSIGGYDIMVATRDATDGSFLQPSNLGFPYNSPYDDYLLAIDELNGVGWWATDRNQLDDMLTIYVFITNDLRNNYPSDEEDLVSYARISDYFMTQPEDGDYDELLATIRGIDPDARAKKPEFTFPASRGRIYHRYDELPDAASKSAMKKYLAAADQLSKSEKALRDNRMKYSRTHNTQLGKQIAADEKNVEKQREETASLLSALYKVLK